MGILQSDIRGIWGFEYVNMVIRQFLISEVLKSSDTCLCARRDLRRERFSKLILCILPCTAPELTRCMAQLQCLPESLLSCPYLAAFGAALLGRTSYNMQLTILYLSNYTVQVKNHNSLPKIAWTRHSLSVPLCLARNSSIIAQFNLVGLCLSMPDIRNCLSWLSCRQAYFCPVS